MKLKELTTIEQLSQFLDGTQAVIFDEVTQFEVVCSVEKISERYLIPVLETILDLFPFNIISFHSDNGSEYINQNVGKLRKNYLSNSQNQGHVNPMTMHWQKAKTPQWLEKHWAIIISLKNWITRLMI